MGYIYACLKSIGAKWMDGIWICLVDSIFYTNNYFATCMPTNKVFFKKNAHVYRYFRWNTLTLLKLKKEMVTEAMTCLRMVICEIGFGYNSKFSLKFWALFLFMFSWSIPHHSSAELSKRETMIKNTKEFNCLNKIWTLMTPFESYQQYLPSVPYH